MKLPLSYLFDKAFGGDRVSRPVKLSGLKMYKNSKDNLYYEVSPDGQLINVRSLMGDWQRYRGVQDFELGSGVWQEVIVYSDDSPSVELEYVDLDGGKVIKPEVEVEVEVIESVDSGDGLDFGFALEDIETPSDMSISGMVDLSKLDTLAWEVDQLIIGSEEDLVFDIPDFSGDVEALDFETSVDTSVGTVVLSQEMFDQLLAGRVSGEFKKAKPSLFYRVVSQILYLVETPLWVGLVGGLSVYFSVRYNLSSGQSVPEILWPIYNFMGDLPLVGGFIEQVDFIAYEESLVTVIEEIVEVVEDIGVGGGVQ